MIWFCDHGWDDWEMAALTAARARKSVEKGGRVEGCLRWYSCTALVLSRYGPPLNLKYPPIFLRGDANSMTYSYAGVVNAEEVPTGSE